MQPFVTFGRTKAISFVAEGFGVCACASGQASVTFGLQKLISFAPKVMVFELALLGVHQLSRPLASFESAVKLNRHPKPQSCRHIKMFLVPEATSGMLTRRFNPQQ